MLAAAATVVNIVKGGFAPRVCAAPLLAKAGVGGKEAEGRRACVKSNTIVSSWQREEDGGLLLRFDVPSAVKEARVLEAHCGLGFARFGVLVTRKRLSQFWCGHVGWA